MDDAVGVPAALRVRTQKRHHAKVCPEQQSIGGDGHEDYTFTRLPALFLAYR